MARKKSASATGETTIGTPNTPPADDAAPVSPARAHHESEFVEYSGADTSKSLYYGDNLEVLRKYIRDGSVDLCYIDPPFNSKRTYNQIYNNIGHEDMAQSQAFVDTWTWNAGAQNHYQDVLTNSGGRFTAETIELVKGLYAVLKPGSLMAYLIEMTVRIVEIHRVLKDTGSFYVHCDPTVSHYLKVVCDAIFSGARRKGGFQNEIAWCYDLGGRISKTSYGRRHDILLFYTKSEKYTFNWQDVLSEWTPAGIAKFRYKDEKGRYRLIGRFIKGSPIRGHRDVSPDWEEKHPELVQRYYLKPGKMQVDFWNIPPINQVSKERLGYPTQKPEALLERVIKASSSPGQVVLDAFCGCGTTIAVAHRLKRSWIGVDITYQAISVILKRLEDTFGHSILGGIVQHGIPKDMASAIALANKKDDRLRKEFEKWAILTYSNNRAIINERKGADQGIDGTAFFLTGPASTAKMVFQVKSGGVKRSDIATLNSDRIREGAELATLITLEEPSGPMVQEANVVGSYQSPLMGASVQRIQIVTVRQIIEQGRRLELPMSQVILKSAEIAAAEQLTFLEGEAEELIEQVGDEDLLFDPKA